MEGLVARKHQVACLCTAGVRLRPGVSWVCDQQEPYKRYTVFNGGVYPAFYSHGGVGSRRPLLDVQARGALRRVVMKIVRAERPEVVSIQSLFGLPLSLVDEIRKEGLPVGFTAHDYFALCPTAHLFLPEEQPCRLSEAGLVCHECCGRSPSYSAFWLSAQLNWLAVRWGVNPVVRNNLWRLRNAVERVDSLTPRRRNSETYRARRREAIEFLKRVDVLHCISQRQAKVFREICGPLTNVCVLPLVPPTITSLAPVPRSRDGNRSVCFVALNVHGAYKGSKLLENAFRTLADTQANYQLHVYGNSVPGPEIRFVFYHGRYQGSELAQIAAGADFCIVPSVCDETLGFVGLEMLARGVPLIVSVRAGVSEFVKDSRAGFVFDPGSPDSILEVIAKILNDRGACQREHVRACGVPLITFPEHLNHMADLLQEVSESRATVAGAVSP